MFNLLDNLSDDDKIKRGELFTVLTTVMQRLMKAFELGTELNITADEIKVFRDNKEFLASIGSQANTPPPPPSYNDYFPSVLGEDDEETEPPAAPPIFVATRENPEFVPFVPPIQKTICCASFQDLEDELLKIFEEGGNTVLIGKALETPNYVFQSLIHYPKGCLSNMTDVF